MRPADQHPESTDSTALPTPPSPSHWVLSGPFRLHSPAPHPRADPRCSSRLGSILYLSLRGSPLLLWVAASLTKSSAPAGVEVGAAMEWVPQGCPVSYRRPHRRRLAGMGDGASTVKCRHCFRFASVVKSEPGHPEQEGEGSSETGGCSGPPTSCPHPHTAALHHEPGRLLVRLLPAARGLTPHPAAQTWHPAPESSIPPPATQIPHPTPSVVRQSQNPAVIRTPAPGSGLWRGAAR